MFDKTLIETVKKKINMVELASQYTQLKQMSSNIHQGPCPHPDHRDSMPSFTVWAHNNTWSCMGCHSGQKDNQTNFGTDCIAFVQWIEQVSFKEAVLMLAEAANIAVPDHPCQKELDTLLQKAKEYPKNIKSNCRKYLNERGITQESVDTFMIGFDGTRVVFPLVDPYRNVIGFTRRVIDDSIPKYRHSPNSELLQINQFLYGFHLLQRDNPYIYITEGPTDVILARQNGLTNVVATLGGGLTEGQYNLVKRSGKIPVLAYDNDEEQNSDKKGPGNTKQSRDLELLTADNVDVHLLQLPPKMDLAEVSLHMKEYFVQYVKDNTKRYSMALTMDAVNKYKIKLQHLKLESLVEMQKGYDRIVHDNHEKKLMRSYILEETGMDPEWGRQTTNDLLIL